MPSPHRRLSARDSLLDHSGSGEVTKAAERSQTAESRASVKGTKAGTGPDAATYATERRTWEKNSE